MESNIIVDTGRELQPDEGPLYERNSLLSYIIPSQLLVVAAAEVLTSSSKCRQIAAPAADRSGCWRRARGRRFVDTFAGHRDRH